MSFFDGFKKGAGEETGRVAVRYGALTAALFVVGLVGWHYLAGPAWRSYHWAGQKIEKAKDTAHRAGDHVGNAAAATKGAIVTTKDAVVDKTTTAIEAAREKAPVVMEQTREKVGESLHNTLEAATKAGERGLELGSEARQRWQQWREKRKAGEPDGEPPQ